MTQNIAECMFGTHFCPNKCVLRIIKMCAKKFTPLTLRLALRRAADHQGDLAPGLVHTLMIA